MVPGCAAPSRSSGLHKGRSSRQYARCRRGLDGECGESKAAALNSSAAQRCSPRLFWGTKVPLSPAAPGAAGDLGGSGWPRVRVVDRVVTADLQLCDCTHVGTAAHDQARQYRRAQVISRRRLRVLDALAPAVTIAYPPGTISCSSERPAIGLHLGHDTLEVVAVTSADTGVDVDVMRSQHEPLDLPRLDRFQLPKSKLDLIERRPPRPRARRALGDRRVSGTVLSGRTWDRTTDLPRVKRALSR